MDVSVTDASDRSPIQSAEMYNQVWGHIFDTFINLLRLEHQRIERTPLIVLYGFKLCFDFILKSIVLAWRNHTLRLASLHIEEYARIITAFAPDFRFLPVNFQLTKRSNFLRKLFQHQQSFFDQPFIYCNAAIQPLRPMVGNNQHDCILVE